MPVSPFHNAKTLLGNIIKKAFSFSNSELNSENFMQDNFSAERLGMILPINYPA